MHLKDYRDLIRQMPVSAHAFTSSRKNWATHAKGTSTFSKALRKLFGKASKITLSRSDLRHYADTEGLELFAVATLLWGYPAGMRGTHVSKIRKDFQGLMQLLESAREAEIDTWETHRTRLSEIGGVGISTYSKFLCFLSIRIEGHLAMIFDATIARVAQSSNFSELAPIAYINYDKGLKCYPEYLRWIHETAADLKVSAEKLELFLFNFGENLKAP